MKTAGDRRHRSKHAKYTTHNPLSSRLVDGFIQSVAELVVPLGVRSILDVGCGEGLVLRALRERLPTTRLAAFDLDSREVADARANLPGCGVAVASAGEMPCADSSFELVMCCEVLEHVTEPARVLRELTRVSARHVLLSVPREPLWRCLNLVRGAYWRHWGNTPGHLNHWSSRGFERFVARELDIVARRRPLPWTVLLGTVR